jgi:hypothetical protein
MILLLGVIACLPGTPAHGPTCSGGIGVLSCPSQLCSDPSSMLFVLVKQVTGACTTTITSSTTTTMPRLSPPCGLALHLEA